MPRADITEEYSSNAGQNKFPRLKLQTNERARIVVVSKPMVEYVHRLEAPNIVNMSPTYKKIKDREGNDKFVVDTRFVSGPICFGAYEILKERGFDDGKCPACVVARDRPDIFRPPQPKYSANVLRYNLRPGGGWNDISTPFGVSAIIWCFGGKVMDKLIAIRNMGPAYQDIRTVDLLIECDEQNFQKPYSNGEFLPVSPAVWLYDDNTRNYTAQYLASNGASEDDLVAAIGKRVKEDWLSDDINRVIQRWDVVRAYEARQGGQPAFIGQAGFGGETLAQGMQHLQQQYGAPPQGFVPPGPQGYAGQPPRLVEGQQFGLAGSPAPHITPQQQAAANGGYFPGQAEAYAAAYGQQPQQHQAPAAGVDMGLLGGHYQPQQHQQQQPPAPPAGPLASAMGMAEDPALAAQRAALAQQPQWQPGQPGTPFPPTPPAPTAGIAAPPAIPSGVPPMTAASPSSQLGNVLGPPPGNPLAGLADVMSTPPSAPAQPPWQSAPASMVPGMDAAPAQPPAGLAGLQEFMNGTTSNPAPQPGPAQPPASPVPPAAPGNVVDPVAAATPPPGGQYTFADLARMGQAQ